MTIRNTIPDYDSWSYSYALYISIDAIHAYIVLQIHACASTLGQDKVYINVIYHCSVTFVKWLSPWHSDLIHQFI